MMTFQGNDCEYRHSEGARMNPRDCWYWLNGNCLNPKCAFRHPVSLSCCVGILAFWYFIKIFECFIYSGTCINLYLEYIIVVATTTSIWSRLIEFITMHVCSFIFKMAFSTLNSNHVYVCSFVFKWFFLLGVFLKHIYLY